jgi:hypothetical protein
LKECWGQAKGTKLIPRKPSRLLHQHSSGSSIAGKMSSSSSMPDVTHDLPPRLDKPPAIYVAESDSKLQDVRKSTSYNAPLSVPIFPSNPDLAFQEPDRRKSVDNTEKRRSWWSHRKSSSDGEGMMVQAEDFEKKEQMFKTYFAVEKTEKLIHGIFC